MLHAEGRNNSTFKCVSHFTPRARREYSSLSEDFPVKASLIIAILMLCEATTARATETPHPSAQNKSSPPPRVSHANVNSSGRVFWQTVYKGGASDVMLLRQDCYNSFSTSPSWQKLDRCLTFDWLAHTMIMLDDRPILDQKWKSAAKRLGKNYEHVRSHFNVIKKIAPRLESKIARTELHEN